MMRCGLLGQKLSHSYSPQIHQYLGDYTYSLFEVQPDELAEFIQSNCFDGINVTIPYKKSVIPYCDHLSPIAQKLGAVNTIVRQADGSLIGHNTDYFGFQSMLKKSGLQIKNKKVLVLGSGGASATVCSVLEEYGAKVVVISRSGKDNYNNIGKHSDAAVIVNSTPVGMYPNNDQSPVELDQFPVLEGVLDLIYNPCRTKLLSQALERGLRVENGLWMLVAQATESAQWFQQKALADSIITKTHKALSKQMQNIILIGMPGCGKSSIGAALARKLQMEFIDSDEAIVQQCGKPISTIFQEGGETEFRKIETEVLSKIGKKSATVIATGGGCVTIPENYRALHQNGTIIWIQRDISQLPTDGRPLSQSGSLAAMYEKRRSLYAAFADHIVSNDGTVNHAVSKIMALEER